MKYFLIVEELKAEPGLYGTYHTEKQIKNLTKSKKTLYDKIYEGFIKDLQNISYLTGSYFNPGLIRLLVPEVPNNRSLEETGNRKMYRNAIRIDSAFIKYCTDYDSPLFCDTFKSSNHFSALLHINSGNELIIMNYLTAKEYFNRDRIESGLYVSNSDLTELYRLDEFSIRKWKFLTSKIQACFLNLGAKSILIEEEENREFSGSIEAEQIKKLSARFKTESSINHNFSFQANLNNSVFNPKEARKHIDFFKTDFIHTYELADFLINNKRQSGDNETKESVDFKFNLSLEVLSAFQGCLKGGFRKSLRVKISY